MQDGFQRKITYLRVSLTDLCNLRCRYCMPECGVEKFDHDRVLRFEEVEEIVRMAVELGVRKVRLTGGEPLVRRGLPALCAALNAIPGLEELTLTTNAVLLEEQAQALKDAGVRRVNISLDTLNPDKFRDMTRGGDLDRVLRGIAAARAVGMTPIKLNTVLIGGFNDDEIPALVELTRDRDLEVRFIELMPLGPGAAFPPSAFLPCTTVLERVPELREIGSSGVARLYRLPDGRGKVGLITPVSHDFCAECDRLRLTSDGKLKPCLHSDREIPLRGLHGEALRQTFLQAVALKPERHEELEPGRVSAGGRPMNRIGG
ncbi:MAG: GTP 3',8-cyclase MoaA [Oscillospiraceae bacterium]|nr:GTP 3',8-cyclase MoaA [Oscillospiraceae bacterium]